MVYLGLPIETGDFPLTKSKISPNLPKLRPIDPREKKGLRASALASTKAFTA
jgi:hypothetical protein